MTACYQVDYFRKGGWFLVEEYSMHQYLPALAKYRLQAAEGRARLVEVKETVLLDSQEDQHV